MSDLQFSLFFVALLVGYLLVHLRLVRFEGHLQKLAGIRSLDDRLRTLDERLKQLAESFDKVRLDRVEGGLDRLHDDLEDLREATLDVRHAVVHIPQPTIVAAAENPAPVVTAEPAGARVQAVVETRLLQLGYGGIQILSDLRSASSDGECEVLVEAERGNMPVKGRVVVRNGAVRDVALQSVVQMFP
jgi:hypothetical protein